MIDTRSRHRRGAAGLVPLALLVLAAATGCGKSDPPLSGAEKVDWSTVCHGLGGSDLRSLLSDPAEARVDSNRHVDARKSILSVSELCDLDTRPGGVGVLVSTKPGTAAQVLAKGHFGSQAPQTFAAGEGAHVWPAHAQAVLTCRTGGGTPVAVLVDVSLTGSAAHVADRTRLMEHLVRTYADATHDAAYCNAKA